MRAAELVGRARALSAREWADLARAYAALLRASAEVRSGRRGLAHRSREREGVPAPRARDDDDATADGRPATGDPAATGGPAAADEAAVRAGAGPRRGTTRAEELALAVERAVEYGPFRFRCLVEAVALRRLLERAGIDGGVVRVGVRREGGEFAAHAWVELGGVPLRQRHRSVESYTALPELDVFPER